MSPVTIGAVGMVSGAAVFVLGIAQLACEHSRAPLAMRACIAALALLGAWTAADSWDAWAGVVRRMDLKAVALCAVLALYWGYRRTFSMSTEYRPTGDST